MHKRLNLYRLGNKLRDMREKAEMTQKQAAEVNGVSEVSINSWEHGKKEPRLSHLVSLRDCYDARTGSKTTIDDLL